MNLFLISASRNPKKGVSTVRTNALKPALSALWTKLLVTSLEMGLNFMNLLIELKKKCLTGRCICIVGTISCSVELLRPLLLCCLSLLYLAWRLCCELERLIKKMSLEVEVWVISKLLFYGVWRELPRNLKVSKLQTDHSFKKYLEFLLSKFIIVHRYISIHFCYQMNQYIFYYFIIMYILIVKPSFFILIRYLVYVITFLVSP